MAEIKNPFTPNFGQVPLYMAGRKFLLGEIGRALENGPGDPALSSILAGPAAQENGLAVSFVDQGAADRLDLCRRSVPAWNAAGYS